MTLLLGIDLGTSYFKVGLFDAAGTMKGLGRVAVPKQIPAPGRCELEVEKFWLLLRQGLAEALAEAGASSGDIAGVSYSSQANTFVLLDHEDRPLTPLVSWLDERGDPVEEAMIRFSKSVEFAGTVGFAGILGFCAAPKWRWFQRNEPGLWSRTRRAMTISDYLTFALTGERAGDASTAALMGFYDLKGKCWWSDALRAFSIDPALLSDPLPPGARCGQTTSKGAALLGLPAGVPFTVGGLDHHVAGLGCGLGRLGELCISTGTVLAAMTLVDVVTPRPGCYHGLHFDRAGYFRMAFNPKGAGQLEDYRREHAPDFEFERLLGLAAGAPAGRVPESGRQPETLDAKHGVAVRRLLEDIAFSHRALIEQVSGNNPPRRVVATGGGARSVLWLEIKAAVLDATIVTTECPERACLGAAMLAGAGAGVFDGLDEASKLMVRQKAEYAPSKELREVYRG